MALAHLAVLFIAIAAVATTAEPPPGHHPVFIAGPLLAQSLEINNSIPDSVCNSRGEFKWLWGNPNITTSDALCLLEGLTLGGFNAKDGLSVPKEHIEVRVRGGLDSDSFQAFGFFFGSGLVDGEPEQTHLLPMLRKRGYADGESMFQVAYDWRLSVNDWQLDVFPLTKKRIEKAVQQAGGRGAVLTGLSMAGPFLHAFLSWVRTRDPEWPRQHVHAFVPVAGPWNGAVMALSAVLGSALKTWSTEGLCPRCSPPRKSEVMPDPASRNIIDQFIALLQGIEKTVLDAVLGRVIRTMPSMYFMSTGIDYSTLVPRDEFVFTLRNGLAASACHGALSADCGAKRTRSGARFDDEGFLTQKECAECVRSPSNQSCARGYDLAARREKYDLCCKRHECKSRSYRASEMPGLFRFLRRSREAQLMEYALDVGTTNDPGVPVHCIYSHNVQTFSYLLANSTRNIRREDIVLDDGDQTVDGSSAQICSRWPSTVKTYRVPGVRHASMLDIKQVNEVIVAVATDDTPTWAAWMEPRRSELIYSSNHSVVPIDELLDAGMVNLFV